MRSLIVVFAILLVAYFSGLIRAKEQNTEIRFEAQKRLFATRKPISGMLVLSEKNSWNRWYHYVCGGANFLRTHKPGVFIIGLPSQNSNPSQEQMTNFSRSTASTKIVPGRIIGGAWGFFFNPKNLLK